MLATFTVLYTDELSDEIFFKNSIRWLASISSFIQANVFVCCTKISCFTIFVTFGAKEHSSNNIDITAGPRSFSKGIILIHASTISNHPFSEVEKLLSFDFMDITYRSVT